MHPKLVSADVSLITEAIWMELHEKNSFSRESENASTSDEALPIADVVKSWSDIKEGDEFMVKCKVVKGKFELNLD